MAEQDNTPQGGFGQAELLNFHTVTDADASDIQALIRQDTDRAAAVVIREGLRTLLAGASVALAIVRRGEPGTPGRIVAMAQCSSMPHVAGRVGIIGDVFLEASLASETSELQLQVRLALVERLLEWADGFLLPVVEIIGPQARGDVRDGYVDLGFGEIDDDSALYIRRYVRRK